MLYQVIYSSKAAEHMSAEALEAILDDARAGNRARGITGVLVYADGLFLQILEGEAPTVRALMASIDRDRRHEQVTVFHEAPVETRAFESWSMAYIASNCTVVANWAGLEGASSIEAVLDQVHREPDRVPRILVSLVEALAAA